VKIYIYTILCLLFIACSSEKTTKDEKPIAKAFNEYLYFSDLKDLIKDTQNKEDSLSLVNSFIDKWSKKEVLLHLAEKNLPNEEIDVSKELENYRTSLLIYKYQQYYINQKLDTNVSEAELKEYFNTHINEFELQDNIVKANFIQLPKSAPNISIVKNLYTKDDDKSFIKLDNYCNKYAIMYNNFNKDWVLFNTLQKLLPLDISEPENFLKQNKNIEVNDSNYFYFVHIFDYKTVADVAPFEFASKQILSIILTKRKISLINDLENNALKEEIKNNNVKKL